MNRDPVASIDKVDEQDLPSGVETIDITDDDRPEFVVIDGAVYAMPDRNATALETYAGPVIPVAITGLFGSPVFFLLKD